MGLLVIIGANTREISRLVIRAYLQRRMQALHRLQNIDCKVGPKLDKDRSVFGISSKSRQSIDKGAESSVIKSSASKKKLKADALLQSKSWLESRLSYRRLIHRMIKEIETHCEDVICLS